MLNQLFGWYVREKLNARQVSLVWEQSIAKDGAGSFTIADAEDAATHTVDLVPYDYILTDVVLCADPGFVKLEIYPDGKGEQKFRLEATKNQVRIPLPVPMLVEADVELKYENEAQPNDLYVSFSGMKLTKDSLAKFTLLSELVPGTLDTMAARQLTTNKLLQNVIDAINKTNPTYAVSGDGVTATGELSSTKERCKGSSRGCS